MTDTWPLGRAVSAMTIELEQQMVAGTTVTVSQHTVSRTGSQQMGAGAGSQQTVS